MTFLPLLGRHNRGASSLVGVGRKSPGDRSLKMLSGSCCLPHPDKEETGGEDAHFICDDEKVIGVADGVGGWADLGVDAGQYAKELMSNSVSALLNEPEVMINPLRVLEKAYYSTKAKGSSTACIIALTNQRPEEELWRPESKLQHKRSEELQQPESKLQRPEENNDMSSCDLRSNDDLRACSCAGEQR
ncbi:putative protein phosphatase 2C 55 [Platanthera guangdongensis]|uniref:Protein phosphatase n=1 Tax=Platanthera guangdongensis TaxID=2320717 RepID=A0ABR2N1Z0_9ASPA